MITASEPVLFPARSMYSLLLRYLLLAVAGYALISSPAALAQNTTDSSTAQTLVLTNANIIDGMRAEVIPNATVIVSDRKIQRIEQGDVQPPANAEIIDLGGRYLVPGLIDVHTHLSSLDGARRALASGVTTVRSSSVGSYQDVALREMVRQGVLPGPDVLATGLFVTPDLGENILADPRLTPLHDGVNTPDELRLLVRVNIDRGVDWIKTRGTERAGLPETDPRKQVYTEEQLRAIVKEAEKGGVPVQAHAHGDEGARAAVRAGVRSIEHGTYLSNETLALMRENGTFLVPTYTTVVDLVEPGGEYDGPTLRLRGQHMLPRLQETVRRAHGDGIKLVTGADTGYGPESVTRVATEVANFVELGMTPFEALQTATTTAAELLELEARTGAIQPGYEADLIVVEGNPLADIRALQDVLIVISNGQVAVNRLPFARE